MDIKQLQLETIRIDGGTQCRFEINLEHVSEFSAMFSTNELAASVEPVVVFFDGTAYWLADGFHRYHGARKANRLRISADVRKGTQRDAILFSVEANHRHGLKRTNADKRKAVETLLNDEEWSAKSDRWIADMAGVHAKLVSEIRLQVRTSAPEIREKPETPLAPTQAGVNVETREGADGKNYPARRGRSTTPEQEEAKRKKEAEKEAKRAEREANRESKKAADLAAKRAKESEKLRKAEEKAAAQAAKEAELKDSLGHAVSNGYSEIFSHCKTFNSLIHRLGAIAGEVEKLCQTPAGMKLHYEDFKVHIKNAQSALTFAKPYCPVPPISEAKDAEQKKRWQDCSYLVALEYRQLTDRQKSCLK